MSARQSVDEYLGRRYVVGEYNCFHFAAEVWQDLTGQDLIAKYGDAVVDGSLSHRAIKHFKVLDKPQDPCIVLLQVKRQSPHIGVYLRGKVLHIRSIGARYEPVHFARVGFTKIRYVLPC